jgi:allophanate hydrolase
VPAPEELASCDEATRAGFAAAVEQAGRAGYTIAEIDLSAYLAAGDLLYGGGLVAERYAAVGAFLAGDPPGADPTVAAIIGRAGSIPAWRYASDRFELAALAAEAAELWHTVDAILTPVAPRHPTLDEVAADPVGVNLALGRFTSGCNPVDWCAVVFATGAAPLGVQLLGPPWSDPSLWTAAAHLRGEPVPADADTATGPGTGSGSAVRLAVAGAHLSGQPLNHQLTDRAATLELSTTTAPRYRMIAIEGDIPKPGLYRVGDGVAGAALEVEVWALEPCAFGSFVAEVPPPLAIGTIELADGSWVPGFICEPFVIPEATDITDFGGWRAWLTAR